MGSDSITCPSCGAKGSATDKFCGSCGAVISTAPAAPSEKPAPARKQTMLGMTSVPPGGPSSGGPPAESPAQKPAPSRKQTMLGMTGADVPGAAPAPAPAKGTGEGSAEDPALQKTMLGIQSPLSEAGSVSPTAHTIQAETKAGASAGQPSGGGGQTVFGVQASDSSRPQAQGADQAKPAPSVNKKGTMLGMTSPLAAGAAPAAQEGPATSQGTPGTPETTKKAAESAKGRTMLGMMSPLAGGTPAEPEAPKGGPAKGGDPKTNRTMLGMVQPAGPAPGPEEEPASPEPAAPAAPARFTPPGDAPSFSRPSTPDADLPLPGATAKKASGALLWVSVVGVLVAAVVAAVLILFEGPNVTAEVAASKQGDVLRVRVPEAAPGTKVRFGGKEAEIQAGVAQLPLAADSLKVGKNTVSIDIVEPGGDVTSAGLELQVDYRARLDLAPLDDEQPAVSVVIDALPGSSVKVAGKPVEVDSAGRATVAYPVQDSQGARFDLTVPYRIEPPGGAAVEGTLELHLPVVSMQIDRPGEEVFTDADHIEIGGAVEKGASVRVGGQEVPVTEGRFLHTQPLGPAGEYRFSVVARAQGKAPSAREVKVTRVENMAIAAAAFEFDPGLTYARIAQNPTIYRGQHVAFDGRVYNVEVQGGRSILQMLVRDCPRGHKCQLWVDYAQATDATVGSMVRVLGVLSGEQQYRAKKGGVQTAPAVSARFILPLVK